MNLIPVVLCVLFASTSAAAEVNSYVRKEAFIAEVRKQTVAREFARLDTTGDELRKSKARSEDGVWKLALLYKGINEGLTTLANDDANWSALDQELLSYAQRRPGSSNAWLIYAMSQKAKAWRHRGTGFSNTTTPEGRAAFRKYMLKARDVLEAHKKELAGNPEWYAHRISIATYLGEDKATVDSLFKEGVTKEPLYYDLYFTVLYHRMPIWGGSIESMATFLNDSLKYTTTSEGASMYARLAWYADRAGFYEVIEFPTVDWKVMRKSFEDVLRAYPDDWNAQQFLLMACDKGDIEEAKRLVLYVKEPASPALLGKNIPAYEACKKLALGGGEPFLMRHPETGATKLIK